MVARERDAPLLLAVLDDLFAGLFEEAGESRHVLRLGLIGADGGRLRRLKRGQRTEAKGGEEAGEGEPACACRHGSSLRSWRRAEDTPISGRATIRRWPLPTTCATPGAGSALPRCRRCGHARTRGLRSAAVDRSVADWQPQQRATSDRAHAILQRNRPVVRFRDLPAE